MSNIFQWQLHGDGKTLAPGEVVEPDERLTWVRTAGIGAQHVIAMFGATFLVPILTGFDPSTTLFFTAMSTALFLLINRNVLPSYLGSSFGFIAPITAVTTANKGIAVASFGIMVTGILLALVGVLVHYAGSKWIDIIMPPVVNGAIVAIIGFNLAPSVWTNFQAAPDTALVTLLAVLLVAVLFKGLLGRLNILVGVIIGYVYACIRGQVDFSAIGDAAWIGFPKFHLPQADFSILPMFIPVVLVLVAENVGHVKSVAQMTGRDYDNQIGTALMADGLGTTLAGFGGGLLGVIHRLAHLALELGVQRLALLDRNLTLLDEFVDELAALLVSGGKGSDARQQDLAQAITQKIKISHDTPPSRSDMAWCHVSYHQA